ncbi:MAG: periplasmic protein TonB [Gammaproteobacteria bacterium]|jgi:protein TonB|nr:periplasmic protein TonB [Gammaproteobacteria bacterium]
MNNFALAYDFTTSDRWAAAHRRKLTIVTVPWREVPLARVEVPFADGGPSRWVLIALVAAMAISVHGGLVWYASHRTAAHAVPPRKHAVQIELVKPPEPPPPKVEPPKPLPPRQQVKRQQVRALPQIQTAVADTSVVDNTTAEAPIAVAPAVQVSPPEPEPITAPFGRAGYLNNPPPQYPNLAARNGWQGIVLLKVRVLSTGGVDTVEVEKSSGFKLLDEEAKATVRTWRFSPSKRGSTPIDGWATVPIEFKLDT